MGTTGTAINADAGIELCFVVAIEGIPHLITSGSPSAVMTAWSGSDHTSCLGGLTIRWEQGASVDPWKPFSDPAILSFYVVPAVDSTGALVDTFGVAVGKRTPTSETRLDTALDCDDVTAIEVKRTNEFAASGDVYLGPETIGYAAKDNGAAEFQTLTRGKYCPLTTKANGAFAHTHRPVVVDGQTVVSIPPIVTTSPVTWVGRWVEVWIHRVVGGVLDVKAQAHRGFVGTIADVGEGDNGETAVSLESAQRRIYESVLLREPFRAQLKEGIYLYSGISFTMETARQVSGGGVSSADTNPLRVVASGASTTNQMNAGVYTCTELADLINRWLAAEKANGRSIFNVRYTALATHPNGLRPSLRFDDATATALHRIVRLKCSHLEPFRFMGWFASGFSDEIKIVTSAASGTVFGPLAPSRFAYLSTTAGRISLTQEKGTFYDQSAILPASLQGAGFWKGVLKFGDLGYALVAPNAGYYSISTAGVEGFLPTAGLIDALASMTAEDASLEVQQVLIAEGTFNSLLLKILLSTGTTGFNHVSYDVLPEGLGCAIPFSILGDDFLIDLLRLEDGGRSLCAIISEPIRFIDLFESDFILRKCFFAWGAGRLQIKGWATPITALATITLDETSKAVPADAADGDLQRTTKTEDDGSMYNVVKIRTSRRADESYADELTIIDANSVRDHGARSRTVDARNTSGPGSGPVGVDVRNLLDSFRRAFTLFSRPFWRIKRTLARTHFEQAIPGVIASLTDKYLRDPATGLRYSHHTGTGGVSARPVLVIGHDFDWGGPDSDVGGEVELMLLPRTSTGVYCPAALVDETQANAGYNAGTGALTVYAHAYSDSGDAVDASRFSAPMVMRITQIDPDVAASALSWTRTISTVVGNVITPTATLSAPAWDATLKYRITFTEYTGATATQQAYVYQADDADGLIADARQPYEIVHTSGGQSATYTLTAASEPPALYATNQIGDGVALDVGGEFDIARLANHLIHYKTAPQCPRVYSELRSARTPAGTWELIETFPVFVGMGTIQVWQTRKLYVAPCFRSTTGGTASVRITLSRYLPSGATRSDVTFPGTVEQTTFTSTSTTFAIPAAVGLPIKHLKLTDGVLGGVGFISIEVSAVCESAGLARQFEGPLE